MALVRSKTSALGTVLVTGVLAFCTPERAAAADPPRYTAAQVSLETDQEILNLRFYGGRTRMEEKYSLMGDGRVFISTLDSDSATPVLVSSGKLSDAELSTVVEAVIRARLYALNTEQLEAQRRLAKTPGPYISGAGGLEVRIHLSLFPGTAPDGNDELESTFGVHGSDMVEAAYPGVAELAAVREIYASIRRTDSRIAASAKARP